MAKIQTVFFWLGGVIAETIPEVTARVLYNQPIEKLDIQTRLRFRKFAQELCLGRMTGMAFCQEVSRDNRVALSAEALESAIKEGVRTRSSVLEVLAELCHAYQPWLISDYPPEWYEAIEARVRLSTYFSKDHLVFTSSCQLTRMVPDLFYYLAWRANQPIEACLVIDGIPKRAVQALQHGVPSAIFVNADRLKFEFVLRRMLPSPPGFVHPGDSQELDQGVTQ